MIGNYREEPPLIADTPPGLMIDVTLPAFGYAVLAPNEVEAGDCAIGEGAIENAWYRIRVDAATGGLLSCYDKQLERELVSKRRPLALRAICL